MNLCTARSIVFHMGQNVSRSLNLVNAAREIPAVSSKIEQYLNIEIMFKQREEILSIGEGNRVLRVASPIQSVSSVVAGSWPLFTDGQELNFSFRSGSVLIDLYEAQFKKENGFKVDYYGGLASTTADAQFTFSGGTVEVGNYVFSQNTGGLGYVKSVNLGTSNIASIEIVSGIFEDEDTFSVYEDADLETFVNDVSAFDLESDSIANSHPEIFQAAVIECAYRIDRKMKFRQTVDSKDQSSINASNGSLGNDIYTLQAEAASLLKKYKRLM